MAKTMLPIRLRWFDLTGPLQRRWYEKWELVYPILRLPPSTLYCPNATPACLARCPDMPSSQHRKQATWRAQQLVQAEGSFWKIDSLLGHISGELARAMVSTLYRYAEIRWGRPVFTLNRSGVIGKEFIASLGGGNDLTWTRKSGNENMAFRPVVQLAWEQIKNLTWRIRSREPYASRLKNNPDLWVHDFTRSFDRLYATEQLEPPPVPPELKTKAYAELTWTERSLLDRQGEGKLLVLKTWQVDPAMPEERQLALDALRDGKRVGVWFSRNPSEPLPREWMGWPVWDWEEDPRPWTWPKGIGLVLGRRTKMRPGNMVER